MKFRGVEWKGGYYVFAYEQEYATESPPDHREVIICQMDEELIALRQRVKELEIYPDLLATEQEENQQLRFQKNAIWELSVREENTRKKAEQERDKVLKALERINAGGEMLAKLNTEQDPEFPRMLLPYAKDAFRIAKQALAVEKETCTWKRLFDGSKIWVGECGHSILYGGVPDGSCKCWKTIKAEDVVTTENVFTKEGLNV